MSDDGVVDVRRIVELPDQIGQLVSEASAEGFDNMSVLEDEWRRGLNRFERPGEILALATIGGEIAGIGGITQDFVDTGWLRMRRFYVRPAFRRRGVARKLALFVLEHALPLNRQIALYAGGSEAKAF